MRRVALVASLLLVSVLAVVGCFSPVDPDCSYLCDASNAFHCPDNFWCDRPDGGTTGYCTRQGYSGCTARPAGDAAADGPLDGGDAGDLTPPGDGAADLGPPVDGSADGATD